VNSAPAATAAVINPRESTVLDRRRAGKAAFAFFGSGSNGMRWYSSLDSLSLSRSVDRDIARAWGFVKDHAHWWIVGLGICLRLIVYVRNHELCFDERSLWGNIDGVPTYEFSSGLSSDQLAPLGFMIAERAIVSSVGHFRAVGRLTPLVFGLIGLLLYLPLSRKVLPRGGSLVALTLFALSDDLIYFSSEVKQYSLDVAVAVALSLATLHAIGRPVSGRIGWGMAVGAIASPWFSFPAVFIVAGCGMALILTSLFAGRLRDAAVWCVVGAAWSVSFVAGYNASHALLSSHTSMYQFWDFAFLPIWPLPMNILRTYQTVGILLEVLVNPLNMVHPRWAGVLLPLLVLSVGAVSLARRSWRAWIVFVVPILLAVVASSIRRYPFHGRLILELVPAFYLLIGLGAQRLCDEIGGLSGLGSKILLVALVGYPCLMSVNQVVFQPARDHNQHGDLHKNLFLQYDDRLPIRPQDLGQTGFLRPSAPGASSEHRNINTFSTVHRRLVGAEADHGPVGGRGRVGQGRAVTRECAQERVDQVRVRAAVAAALKERQVLGILNRRGLRKPADGLGQQMRVVRNLHAPGDLGLGERVFRGAFGLDHRILSLDLLPFEALLASGGVEALAILAGDVEEAAGHLGDDVRVFDRERGGLDGERTSVPADELFANPARAVADHAFGMLAQDSQTGADAVGGVPHGGQPRPVIGPAVHVLLMASPQKLELAQLTLFVQLLDEEIFTAVDDGFHHHVDLAALSLGFNDLFAFVNGSSHGNGAGDVLSGVQGLDRHPGVVGDRGIDVNSVDIRIFEKVTIVGVAGFDSVAIATFINALAATAANRVDFRAGVFLINRDKFGTEA
jgi:hypothetical protein